MFDYPFDWLPTVIAIAALIFARKALNQVRMLRARLDLFEAATRASASPPPIPPLRLNEPSEPTPAAEVAAMGAAAAPSPPHQPSTPPPLPGIATPPPTPQTGPGLEERLGTRWVVWVGGLALALGGFFMVRYSIEQGLLGPGVRTLLGGLFALALLAAGEWTRRTESTSH